MNYLVIFTILGITAYIVQGILGFMQIKYFTKEYQRLRNLGKVAIGRNAGNFKSGTIVMFALNKDGYILDGRKLQGTTIFAKFKRLKGFEGLNIESLDKDSEVVKKENKLTRITILDAVKTYQFVKAGESIPEKAAPISHVGLQLKYMSSKLSKKIRRWGV